VSKDDPKNGAPQEAEPSASWERTTQTDPRSPHEVPEAMRAPAELDHDLIKGAFDQVGQEAHRHARAQGWWAHLDVRNPEHLWGKFALVIEELGELSHALREGRLRTTLQLASAKQTEKAGVYETELSGAEDEAADIVIRLADVCAAAGLDLGGAVVRKLYRNRRRPHGHGGRRF
jgi:NTP pyrophosphatase (non-canonical NTP hydrolase)